MNINGLIGEFLDLQEQWQEAPGAFDWNALQDVAVRGAHAYNEGAGPSFHMLVLDGVEHGEFHQRFLDYSLQAGFDPFKLVHADDGHPQMPVFDHESLAAAAAGNPYSARMQQAIADSRKAA
ncbi:MAG TPA: hypothetical protein VGF27_01415 [Pseudoduganella sp.]